MLLSLVGREPVSGLTSTNYKVVYPDLLPWGQLERKAYEDPNERHQVKSTFVWSLDGRMVAFVEANQQKFWLTILKFKLINNDAAISHTRFDLGTAASNISEISWLSGGDQIKVNSDKTAWLVNLESGAVQLYP